jgi:hypothetical protein
MSGNLTTGWSGPLDVGHSVCPFGPQINNMMMRSVPALFISSVAAILVGLLGVLPTGAANGLPTRFQADRDRLSAAFDAFHKASELTKPPPGKSTLPDSPQHTRSVLEHLGRGLAAGDAVGDEFLDWLHPEMRHYFRNRFMAGQRSYHDGLKMSDVSLQSKGITLIQEWDRAFWVAHAQRITDKAFQDVDERSTSTLPALGIMFAACTIGLIAVGAVMIVMGLSGAPGAMIFEAGERKHSAALRAVGFTLAALGQSYVVGAYAVLLVSVLRVFSATRPHLATWPLWVAAFFHAGAVTAYAMKERPEMPTAQHYTLGVVSLLSFAIFLMVAISPSWLSPLYEWVPFFAGTLK